MIAGRQTGVWVKQRSRHILCLNHPAARIALPNNSPETLHTENCSGARQAKVIRLAFRPVTCVWLFYGTFTGHRQSYESVVRLARVLYAKIPRRVRPSERGV